MSDKIKVLFIAGRGRSGSTILDNILGQIDGFFSAGELRYLRNRSLIENRFCGCGNSFRKCKLWSEILGKAFMGNGQPDVQMIINLLRNYPQKWHIPLFLVPWRKLLVRLFFRRYLINIEKLYRGIYLTTKCRVIVDSSKFPPLWISTGFCTINRFVRFTSRKGCAWCCVFMAT